MELDRILTMMAEDAFAAIDELDKHEDRMEVVDSYKNLILKLYWEKKNLPCVVLAAIAGIQYALNAARTTETSEPEAAGHFYGEAKGMAYNLASFTWIGWNEPGITVGATDEHIGLEAAKLNLRLAVDLSRGDLPLSRAHWMLGAQYLSAAQQDKAKASFAQALLHARAAGSEVEFLLATGYSSIASTIFGTPDETALIEWDELMKKLGALENGHDLIAQLNTAKMVLWQKLS